MFRSSTLNIIRAYRYCSLCPDDGKSGCRHKKKQLYIYIYIYIDSAFVCITYIKEVMTIIVEKGWGLSDRAGNSGHPRPRDTVAAILHKADERSSPTTENLL
jgi:hypothetical protein